MKVNRPNSNIPTYIDTIMFYDFLPNNALSEAARHMQKCEGNYATNLHCTKLRENHVNLICYHVSGDLTKSKKRKTRVAQISKKNLRKFQWPTAKQNTVI